MGAPWQGQPAWAVVARAEAALGEPLAPLLLAGSAEDLARTRESQLSVLLTSLVVWEAAKEHLPAPVAFAGHSLGQITALIASSAPAAPIVSNEDTRPYADGDGWADRLPRHLISPVRWRGCMTTLVDGLGATTLVEVGFGSMLAGLAKRGAPGVSVIGVATPDDIAPLSEVRP